jgi:putative ABC transport system substrate-binding protein
MSVIGLLQIGAPGYDLAGFREGLKEAGYVEGRNLAVEYRWANRDLDRLPVLAADLVQHKVRVIAVLASVMAARAAQLRRPLAQSRLSLVSVQIQWNWVWSLASIGQVPMSPG